MTHRKGQVIEASRNSKDSPDIHPVWANDKKRARRSQPELVSRRFPSGGLRSPL